MSGTKLIVTGYVFTTDCQPIAKAWLDFWQADSRGQYDNTGYTLRGHQFTDSQGHYQHGDVQVLEEERAGRWSRSDGQLVMRHLEIRRREALFGHRQPSEEQSEQAENKRRKDPDPPARELVGSAPDVHPNG